MKPRQQTALFVLIAVISTAGIVGGIMYVLLNPATPEGNSIEIYHWWTSGGEATAINGLIDVFEANYPGTTVYSVQIAGGAGAEMRTKIKTLMIAGEPPDTFQIHAGYEWKIFYEGGFLEPINDIWTPELQSVIPDVIEDMNKGPDGNYYSVPVNIHRSNLIWYNKHILDNNGIDPATLTTWNAFFSACQTIQANNFSVSGSPVAMGKTWTEVHAFETIMASQGMNAYEAWINGDIDSTGATYYPDLLQACIDFDNLTSNYINSDYVGIDWDSALAKIISVISPTAAFSIMGDWADGEFQQAGWTFNTDYGVIPVPGTNNTYGLVVDCFEKPKNIEHPTNVGRWLTTVSSVAGQDAFNPSKGSIPARTDCNVSLYGPYQQWAMSDFSIVDASGTFFPSVAHGSGIPEEFATDLGPIIGSLTAGSITPAQAATQIVALAVTYSTDFTRIWALD
ncbi:MAG: ABC transporter substrate-binding protein [Promethearchaeota archaeon]